MQITFVDEDCNLQYKDGSRGTCPHRPSMTFQDCDVGYGGHGECPKWDYYHIDEKSEVKK